MPQAVYELRHDNGKADAYNVVGTDVRAICANSFVGKGSARPPHVEVTVSTDMLLGGQVKTLTIVKTGGVWKWRMPKAKFPIVVYPEAEQLFNSFFPTAQEGDEFTLWVKPRVLPP